MHRYELTDEQWEAIASVFPPPALTGRPQTSARFVVNAIFWVLRSGAPWRDPAGTLRSVANDLSSLQCLAQGRHD